MMLKMKNRWGNKMTDYERKLEKGFNEWFRIYCKFSVSDMKLIKKELKEAYFAGAEN